MNQALKLSKRATNGAAMLLAVIAFMALVLVVALVIDGGLIYGKRAEVAKAVDAAAIAAISNLSQGQVTAGRLAEDMFNANYRLTSRDATRPDVSVVFSQTPQGNTVVDVMGTAHLLPVFIQIFPEFSPFDVSAEAQSKRAKVALSLVLDRSGSMGNNGGWIALPPAADTFVSYFDDATDQMALVTFASNSRVDVPLTRPFQAAIQSAIPRNLSDYIGFTFFIGGLQQGFQEVESASTSPQDEIVKVVVFFTDGLSNTFQDMFPCFPGSPDTLLNLSGADLDNYVHAIDPVSGNEICESFPGPGDPLDPCCPGLSVFDSILGGQRSTLGSNAAQDVRLEAKARSRAEANRIRNAGTVIYTIGLGDNLDAPLLAEIANDPDFLSYNSSQPSGEFEQAPTAADLQRVFRTIARKILIRLSL